MVKEWSWIDRSGWPAGAWTSEPDKREWRDAATGLPCIIRRNERMGFLCGYVGVPETHPAFNKSYDEAGLEVHGGLTFSDMCIEEPEGRGICHTPLPGESNHVKWFGFDCGHGGDHMPNYPALNMRYGNYQSKYRDMTYVANECAQLAQQLADMEIRHASGCVCADCSGAELTARND